MLFFDALYLVCCYYNKKNYPSEFKGISIITVTMVYVMNLFILWVGICQLTNLGFTLDDFYRHKYSIIISASILIGTLLCIRYFRIIPYDELDTRIKSLPESKKNGLFFLAVGYIFLSIFLFVGWGIYKGGQVNRWW